LIQVESKFLQSLLLEQVQQLQSLLESWSALRWLRLFWWFSIRKEWYVSTVYF